MNFRILMTCALGAAGVVSIRGETGPGQMADAIAIYESGQSAAALQAFEQAVRDAAGKPELRPGLEAALIRMLSAANPTFEARRFACQQLAAIGSEASLPALAALLKQEETAGIACLALGAQRTPRAGEILRSALPTATGQARLQVVSALGNQRDPQAVPALTGLVRDPDAEIAGAAIRALGKIGGADAGVALAALRKENQPALAAAVAEASIGLAEQMAAAGNRPGALAVLEELITPACPAHVRRGAFGGSLRCDADGGEARILAAVRGTDELLKPVALAAVGSLPSGAASAKFAAELPKLPSSQQAMLIDALAVRGDAPAREAIRTAAKSTAAEVRTAALGALGRMGDTEAAPLLCDLMRKAQTEAERQEIATVLGQLHGKSVDQAILATLKEARGDAQRELITLASRRGNRAAVPVLLEAAAAEDAGIAKAAFQAVGKLGEPSDLAALLDRLSAATNAEVRSEAELAAVHLMEQMKSPGQRTAALQARLAGTSGTDARCSLLRLLPAAGDPAALTLLKAAAADPNGAVREAAVRALAAWPDDSAWDSLAATCRQPESNLHRTLAFRGLVRLAAARNPQPDGSLLEHYRQLLELAANAAETKQVLGGLAGVADPGALALALGKVDAADVRAEAAAAVRKIAAAIKSQHPQAAQAALNRLAAPGGK